MPFRLVAVDRHGWPVEWYAQKMAASPATEKLVWFWDRDTSVILFSIVPLALRFVCPRMACRLTFPFHFAKKLDTRRCVALRLSRSKNGRSAALWNFRRDDGHRWLILKVLTRERDVIKYVQIGRDCDLFWLRCDVIWNRGYIFAKQQCCMFPTLQLG